MVRNRTQVAEVFSCLILVAFSLSTLAAEAPPAPVQAELIKAIDTSRVTAGTLVLAKVKIEWKDKDCPLRAGAILQGQVVVAKKRSKNVSASELGIVFDKAGCASQQMKPLPLTLAAVLKPEPELDVYGDDRTPPLADAVGLGVNGGLRSVSSAAATVFQEPRESKAPKAVKPGEVVGLGDLKLSVGSGPEGSSILSSIKHNVRLEAGSQLVLVPSIRVTTLAQPSRPATTSTPGSPAIVANKEPSFMDETETCEPPRCHVDQIVPSVNDGKAIAEIPLSNFGYAPRLNRELGAFDHDAALAYLGEQQLLFTFNPHKLVPRNDETLANLRTIRAELIDLRTLKVAKRLDWRVLDNNQYLWQAGPEKLLVHTGRELRMYGPGMEVEHTLSLEGPLDFVRVSPSGTYIAVGVIHERHTPDVHEALREAESREPEEDVQLRVLDANFRVLASVTRSSRDPWPILSDYGEIRIYSVSNSKDRWRVVENTWNKQRTVLAQLNSPCVPQVRTLYPDLLFVVGCDRLNTGKWYKIVGQDGKSILKGWSASPEIEQAAIASTNGQAFAVSITTANKSLAGSASFLGTDLQSARIEVYDRSEVQPKFSTRTASPVPISQSFALSPEADSIALLTRDYLQVYAVPLKH